jgi:hypothetical protein
VVEVVKEVPEVIRPKMNAMERPDFDSQMVISKLPLYIFRLLKYF